MSIRETMRKSAEEAQDVISNIEGQIDNLTKQLNVVKQAQQFSRQEPQWKTKCGMVQHYAQASAWIDRADCSECGQTLQGFQRQLWHFCPACGSEIVAVEKEDTPSDRLARNAIREAVASIVLK